LPHGNRRQRFSDLQHGNAPRAQSNALLRRTYLKNWQLHLSDGDLAARRAPHGLHITGHKTGAQDFRLPRGKPWQ